MTAFSLAHMDVILVQDLFPSNTSASTIVPSGPALPWEVIERVVDHSSGHPTTLRSFVLTCHQLRPRSSVVLFSNILIKRRQQLFAFCDVLRARPELQLVVRSLTISPEAFSPFPLLSISPNLHSITFDGKIVESLLVKVHESTFQCCRKLGRGIQSLTLRGVQFRHYTAFIRFISMFSCLQELECDNIDIWDSGYKSLFQADAQHRLLQ